MSKWIKQFVALLILILLSLAVYWWWQHQREVEVSPKAKHPLQQVVLQAVPYRIMPRTFKAYAMTISPDSASVAAKSNAVITGIHFKAGEQVTKGQLLFSLRSTDIGNQVPKLGSQMQASKLTYERYVIANQDLPGTVSADTVSKAKGQYEQDLSAYLAAKEQAAITSPVNGVVSDTNLSVGSSVNAGSTMVQVVVSGNLQAKYQLSRKDSAQARLGQSVIFVPNHSTTRYSGKVVYLAPELSADDNTRLVRAQLKPTSDLAPNIFGQITQVVDAQYHTLAVPQRLVQSDAQGFYVYVVAQGKIAKQYFKAGEVTGDGWVAVNSGLLSGTRIVVSDVSFLSPGQRVRVSGK